MKSAHEEHEGTGARSGEVRFFVSTIAIRYMDLAGELTSKWAVGLREASAFILQVLAKDESIMLYELDDGLPYALLGFDNHIADLSLLQDPGDQVELQRYGFHPDDADRIKLLFEASAGDDAVAQGDAPSVPPYLDPAHPRYSHKLAAAVSAWLAVEEPVGKSPKQALEQWLRQHALEYRLVGSDGKPNKTGLEACSTVANWRPSGGASKTPGRRLK